MPVFKWRDKGIISLPQSGKRQVIVFDLTVMEESDSHAFLLSPLCDTSKGGYLALQKFFHLWTSTNSADATLSLKINKMTFVGKWPTL